MLALSMEKDNSRLKKRYSGLEIFTHATLPVQCGEKVRMFLV